MSRKKLMIIVLCSMAVFCYLFITSLVGLLTIAHAYAAYESNSATWIAKIFYMLIAVGFILTAILLPVRAFMKHNQSD